MYGMQNLGWNEYTHATALSKARAARGLSMTHRNHRWRL
jgi:hypothetical protein